MRKVLLFLTPLFLAFFLASCGSKERVDTLFINGKFKDVADSTAIIEAVAVSDGRIVALGSAEELESKYRAAEVIDMQGKYVYPGFIDGHAHFLGLGIFLDWCDLTESKSLEEVITRLKAHAENADSGWLRGRGWDQNLWAGQLLPDNALLNNAFPNRPVLVKRVDGHAALANEAALQLAGISAQTAVNGGEIILKDGRPTGLLVDNAVDLIDAVIPPYTLSEKRAKLLNAQEHCFKNGLTTVVDCGLDKEDILLIQQMQNEGELKIRSIVQVSATDKNLQWLCMLDTPIITERLNVRALKCYFDGALGSRGALLKDDYHDELGKRGLQLTGDEKFREYAQWALEHGYQLCTHAIGDEANSKVLKHYADMLVGKNDLRWRIEHAQVVSPAERDLFGRLNIIPSMQPTHATSDMEWADERLGTERLQSAYSLKSLMLQNAWIVLGTDFPVEDVSPLYTFYAAVFRKHPKTQSPTGGFLPGEALTRVDALRGMTTWAAKGSFEEHTRGRLAVGFMADFTVMELDLLKAAENEIAKARITETWVGGKKVY